VSLWRGLSKNTWVLKTWEYCVVRGYLGPLNPGDRAPTSAFIRTTARIKIFGGLMDQYSPAGGNIMVLSPRRRFGGKESL